MQTLYAPYRLEHDAETGMPVLSALARDGSILAAVSEPTLEAAEAELVALVMAVLEARAQDAKDPSPDLHEAAPEAGGHVALHLPT